MNSDGKTKNTQKGLVFTTFSLLIPSDIDWHCQSYNLQNPPNMGCCSSKNAESAVDHYGGQISRAVGGDKGGGGGDEPMSTAEIQSRIEGSEKTARANLGGMKVRYAYVSQRGYYPDGKKESSNDLLGG